jgi:hypothetical protein
LHLAVPVDKQAKTARRLRNESLRNAIDEAMTLALPADLPERVIPGMAVAKRNKETEVREERRGIRAGSSVRD